MGMTLDRTEAGEGFVEIARARLEYRWIPPSQAGRPTLVFLHEGLGCVALWRDFPDRVAEATGCGALVYSRLGYGKSDPVSLPRPLEYLRAEGLEALPELLETLDLRDVVLIGHSDGGSISIIYAGSGHADRLLGAVLMAPHVFNEEMCVVGIRKAAEAYETGDLRAKLARLHGDNVDGAFWGWNRTWLHPDYMKWNIEEYLPRVAVPMLVIQGDDDEYGSAAQWEAIRDQSGGPVTVMALPGVGHSPHRDARDAVADAITRFVAELG